MKNYKIIKKKRRMVRKDIHRQRNKRNQNINIKSVDVVIKKSF